MSENSKYTLKQLFEIRQKNCLCFYTESRPILKDIPLYLLSSTLEVEMYFLNNLSQFTTIDLEYTALYSDNPDLVKFEVRCSHLVLNHRALAAADRFLKEIANENFKEKY